MNLERSEAFVEIEFVVEPNCAGKRLDRYLQEKLRRLSRTRIQGLIERSLLSEKPLKASSLVTAGLRFRLRRPVGIEPETPTNIREVFRDEALLVLDKPAGLPIHPTARYFRGTLVSLLREREGDNRPHPAHRLDRETSGLLVCGRTKLSCQRLMASFVEGAVKKEYLAICEGHPPENTFSVDAPIAEGTPDIRIAVRIDAQVGKPARTDFVVVSRFVREDVPFSLVRAQPQTGRQHQIRIHLREAGYPIVGDKIYGPDPAYFDRFSKGTLEPEGWERLRLSRHALHAAKLSFPHPIEKRLCTFEAAMPLDMADFVRGA
ncbi:MAG: RluA family pseudouridine synthase [Myxococcaceae bacterium]